MWGGTSARGFSSAGDIFRVDYVGGRPDSSVLVGGGDMWALDYLTGQVEVYDIEAMLGLRPQAVLAKHGWTWVFTLRAGSSGWRAHMFDGVPSPQNLVWSANVARKRRTLDADPEGRLYIDGMIYSSLDGSIVWGTSSQYYARWLVPRES